MFESYCTFLCSIHRPDLHADVRDSSLVQAGELSLLVSEELSVSSGSAVLGKQWNENRSVLFLASSVDFRARLLQESLII